MKDQIKGIAIIRPLMEWDNNFIYQTWLKGLYYGSDFFKQMRSDDFYRYYEQIVKRIIGFPGSEVRVACLSDDHEVVLGYCVFNDSTLHWVFVKPQWRKLGIAKELVPDTIKTVTHLTKVGKSLKPKEWAFNPFLI